MSLKLCRARCAHTGRTLRRLVLALLVCLPAGAAAQSTVVLIVERRNAVVAEGVATVVAPDTLLTGRSLLGHQHAKRRPAAR